MPAGYERVWILSFAEALVRIQCAGWEHDEASNGLLAALSEGNVATRWADTQEIIDPSLWVSPVILVEGIGPLLRGGCVDPYRVIEFRRADIERLWPPAAHPKQPRPQKGHWSLARGEALKWLDDAGAPTELGDQAKLEKHIARYLEHRNIHPATSTIRLHVKEWITDFEKSRKEQPSDK